MKLTPLREKIYRAGYTQVEIAKKLGINETSFSKMLSGWRDMPQEVESKLISYLRERETHDKRQK